MTTRKILFVFPDMADLAGRAPRLTMGHVYGAFDGYGILFDPVVQALFGTIPEWAHDAGGEAAADAFLITSCAASSDQCADLSRPGLYVRPANGDFVLARDVVAEKEPLQTPAGEIFHPMGYPWPLLHDRYAGPPGAWMLGEFPAMVRTGSAVAVAFDLFCVLFGLNTEWPEKRLLLGADWMRQLLLATGAFEAPRAGSGATEDMRIDFQAYGVNRLQIQRLLALRGAPRDAVSDADQHYREAVAAWLAAEEGRAREGLGAAFSALADLRRRHSQLELCMCEVPHMGVLLPEAGFFELEWPALSRRTLLSYVEQIEKHGYRVSVEAGAGCWRNLVARFPHLGETLREQWAAGGLDLTNGTYSLPFALLSPLALQYWQFRVGRETFKDAFGMCPDYYQAQENSLSLQMPELLLHFGYAGALHISQNRGAAPGEEEGSFIRWQSPAGHELPAIAVWERILGRKGIHFYFDLPILADAYRDRSDPMVYVNFQDLGYVFLRVQMIRAHKYAPVWGRYATPRDCFERGWDAARAPVRRYAADDYLISENIFYWDLTNTNELSQLERTFRGANLLRQTQFAAFAAGRFEELRPELEAVLPALFLQEAHDAILVQGGRVGEFHGRAATMETPPHSRHTLGDEVAAANDDMLRRLADAQRSLPPPGANTLLNAAGAELPFARVVGPERCNGAPLLRCGAAAYAAGPFGAFAAAPPAELDTDGADAALPLEHGKWRASIDDDGRLELAFGEQVVRSVPVDSRLGRFALQRAPASVHGPLACIRMAWELTVEGVQTVLADVLLHRDSPLAEISLRYAAGRDFDRQDRWGDCLALEMALPAPLATVWRCNPNVRAETAEDRIASPCYLAVRTGAGQAVSFLNEGACLYAADRAAGRIRWLFHVADEGRLQRRLAIVFDRTEALELSRAWGAGVTPAPPPKRSLPDLREGWDTVSAETLVDADTLLISNLQGEARSLTFENAAALDLRDAAGQTLVSRREGDLMECRMGPFELGFLTGLRSGASGAAQGG